MDKSLKTTIGGLVSGLGSLLTAGSFFYPPLLIPGGIVSALGKWFLGFEAKDKDAK